MTDQKLYAAVQILVNEAKNLSSSHQYISIAIDGRCASGKTTLAELLSKKLGCNLIHIDDFFLMPEQRTPQRLAAAGENIDHERFLDEVLTPVSKGEDFSFSPFNCASMSLMPPVFIKHKPITIIEGSYCCHPSLWDKYSLRVFLTVDKHTQLERIIHRNGKDNAEIFKSKWIPLEEKYFSAFDIGNRCDLLFEM